MSRPDERGSTAPLILGFVIIALLMVAGAVAAGQAFVQQRDLQDVCDAAATAAAGSAADLRRDTSLGAGDALVFTGVQAAVEDYLARDPDRRDVQVTSSLSTDGRTLSLVCAQTRQLPFGAAFGKPDGIRHVARSAARAPLS